jgi:HlyD family secretion protein
MKDITATTSRAMGWQKLPFLKERRGLALLILIGGISISGGLLYRLRTSPSSASLEASLIAVEQGTVEKTVNSVGTLELRGQRSLKAPSNGTIAEISVEVGDQVEAGQTLILLQDPQPLTALQEYEYELQLQELSLAQNRQAVEIARQQRQQAQQELQQQLIRFRQETANKLQEKQWELEKQEIALGQQQQQVEIAEVELAEAQEKLTADEELFERGFIAEDQLQRTRKELRNAEVKLQSQQDQLRLQTIERDRSRLSLQQLQQDIANETSETDQALKNAREKIRQAEERLQQEKLKFKQAQQESNKLRLKRTKLEADLQKNRVTAPISGKVLDVKVQSGDGIKAGDELLVIGDPTQEVVQLELSTFEAVKVEPQQPARVMLMGIGDETFTGVVETVAMIAASGNDNRNSDNSAQSGTVSVTVVLDEPSGTILPGSSVSVDIVTEQQQDVIVVPIDVVQRTEGEPFVWVRDGSGKARKQPVELGLEDPTQVEVTSGLRVEEMVIVPTPDMRIEEGILVESLSIPEG